MKKIVYIFAAMMLLYSCQSQLDTYEEYVGDGGKIKYADKIDSLSTSLGWQRVVLEWSNGKDVSITQNLVKWEIGSTTTDSVFLDASLQRFESDLDAPHAVFPVDSIVKFSIYSINIDGVYSKVTNVSPTVYDLGHPDVNGVFTFMKNALYFDNGDGTSRAFIYLSNNVSQYINSELAISYVNTQSQNAQYIITSEDLLAGSLSLDFKTGTEGDIRVNLEFKLPNCIDTVILSGDTGAPVSIEKLEVNYDSYDINNNPTFKTEVMQRHNLSEDELPNFIATTEVLHLDYSVESLADVAFFPNLKRVVLGSGRHFASSKKYSTLADAKSDADYLLLLNEFNLIPNLKFEIYNNQFGIGSYLTEVDGLVIDNNFNKTPVFPTISVLNPNFVESVIDWTVVFNGSFRAYLDKPVSLFDYDATTLKMLSSWTQMIVGETPQASIDPSVGDEIFSAIIDFNEAKTVGGFGIRQTTSPSYSQMPSATVYYATSSNPDNWVLMGKHKEITVGDAYAEISVHDFGDRVTDVIKIKVVFTPVLKATNMQFSLDDLFFIE